jgi:hypothetical protein
VSRLFIRHLSLSIAVFFVSTTSYADEYLPDPIVGYVMGDTLQFRPNPLNIQSETYGDWSVQAIATGLGFQLIIQAMQLLPICKRIFRKPMVLLRCLF